MVLERSGDQQQPEVMVVICPLLAGPMGSGLAGVLPTSA